LKISNKIISKILDATGIKPLQKADFAYYTEEKDFDFENLLKIYAQYLNYGICSKIKIKGKSLQDV
jgi:hypothetical protein